MIYLVFIYFTVKKLEIKSIKLKNWKILKIKKIKKLINLSHNNDWNIIRDKKIQIIILILKKSKNYKNKSNLIKILITSNINGAKRGSRCSRRFGRIIFWWTWPAHHKAKIQRKRINLDSRELALPFRSYFAWRGIAKKKPVR